MQACSNGRGSCTAGTDLTVCSATLEVQCGTSGLIKQMMLDQCGGHANPYHYHTGKRTPHAAAAATTTIACLITRLEVRIPVLILRHWAFDSDR